MTKTYCFKMYYSDIDDDTIVYVEAKSRKDAIQNFKKEYGNVEYKFLGEE